MKIHREGYTSLFMTSIFIAGFIVGINVAWPEQTTWHTIFYIFCALVFLIVLQFFRSPKRDIQPDENKIISPADGKIVAIERTTETEYLNEERIQISIFMSPLNVHLNRYPVGGNVSYFKYHPGKYLVAWHPKSSSDNERTTVVLKTKNNIEILLRQIAGALARRIVCYCNTNDEVKQGEEMGFIKFGSRVDVFVPLDCAVHVKIGDKVTGGQSVLANFNS